MDANVAYYCLHKLKILPHVYERLPKREKAFICAAIKIRSDEENKQNKQVKKRRR